MKSYRDGSWGNHTQARNAVFTGTRQTRPTKKATFPRDKAEKSPFQQHAVSYNPYLSSNITPAHYYPTPARHYGTIDTILKQ